MPSSPCSCRSWRGRARPPPRGGVTAALKVIGPQDGGGEPSIAVGPRGELYVSAPGNAMEFFSSLDHGSTWTKGTSPEAPSGDTSVNVDSSGAVYESNLNGLTLDQNMLQTDVFKSFDRGQTWPQKGQSTLEPQNSSGQPLLVDRQWYDAWIPPTQTTDHALVSMSYHDWGPSNVWVERSTDGGKTFGLPVNVITSPAAIAAS